MVSSSFPLSYSYDKGFYKKKKKSPSLSVDPSRTFKFLHNLLMKMIILSYLKCLEVNMNQNWPYLLS